MISTIERLQQLYEYHRKKADGLMIALAALNEDAIATKKVRAKGILDAAVTIDTQRVNGTHSPLLLGDGEKKRGPYKKRKGPSHGSMAQRQDTAAFLDLFSQTEPRHPEHPRMKSVGGFSKLLAHGYLKHGGKDAAGRYMLLRTTKPFDGRKDAPLRESANVSAKQLQRVLWKFSFKKPRPSRTKQPAILKTLLQQGYLKAQGDGYIRTEKRFTLT
jgi:hypothetical protein